MYLKFTIICIVFLIVSVISAKDPTSKDQPNTTGPKWKRCSFLYSYQTIINECIKSNFPRSKQGLTEDSTYQAQLEKVDKDLRKVLELCGSQRNNEVNARKKLIYDDIEDLLQKIPKRDKALLDPCNPVFKDAFREFPYACARARAGKC